jgi:hypothetical protein
MANNSCIIIGLFNQAVWALPDLQYTHSRPYTAKNINTVQGLQLANFGRLYKVCSKKYAKLRGFFKNEVNVTVVKVMY